MPQYRNNVIAALREVVASDLAEREMNDLLAKKFKKKAQASIVLANAFKTEFKKVLEDPHFLYEWEEHLFNPPEEEWDEGLDPQEIADFVGYEGDIDTDHEDWEEVAGKYIKKRYGEFEKKFAKAKVKNGYLEIYRCISVAHPHEILDQIEGGNSLGSYWAFTLEGAQCYHGNQDHNVVVTALVKPIQIQAKRTLIVNLEPGGTEDEIYIPEGTDILVLEAKEGTEVIWHGKEIVEAAADGLFPEMRKILERKDAFSKLLKKLPVDVIAALRNTAGIFGDYPFFHVSNHPGTPTIHKNTVRTYDDPEGIYLFIKGAGVHVDEWADKKWRWDARLKSEDGYIDIIKFGKDFDRIMGKFGLSSVEEIVDSMAGHDIDDFYEVRMDLQDLASWEEAKAYFESEPWRLYEFLRGYHQDRTAFLNFLKSLGYKGIIDQEGCCVYGGEPQIIVFDPKNIEWGERHENIPGEEYAL